MPFRPLPILDWRPRFDPQSLNFPIRLLAPEATPPKGRTRTWKRTIWLDQRSEGSCTGFGLAHVYGTTPRRKFNVTDEFARERYYRARQEDEWAGEAYEGSSVLGAMEGARKDGIIKSYHWATSFNEIVYAVSYHGPLEIGVNWYSGMMATNSDGFVTATGGFAGGHALCLAGVNMEEKFFVLYNSWGRSWGWLGGAKISFNDLDRLLHEQGEFALAKKPLLPLW